MINTFDFTIKLYGRKEAIEIKSVTYYQILPTGFLFLQGAEIPDSLFGKNGGAHVLNEYFPLKDIEKMVILDSRAFESKKDRERYYEKGKTV